MVTKDITKFLQRNSQGLETDFLVRDKVRQDTEKLSFCLAGFAQCLLGCQSDSSHHSKII